MRTRIAATAAIVSAVIIAVGGLLMMASIKAHLYRGVDQVVQIRAAEVADQLAKSSVPTKMQLAGDTEFAVEVMSGGRLIAASADLDESDRFGLPEQPAGHVEVFGRDQLPFDDDGPYRITARGVETTEGTMTVFVAVSIKDLRDNIAEATDIGAIGLGTLTVILAGVMWLALQRAIAPMEAIRAQADRITGQNLHSRVPESRRFDEIGRLAQTINRMLGRLERSAEQQRRFVADAAHELRSPIASLRVQLETSRDGVGVRGREDDLLHETIRMESLVDQLLLLAHADADTPWLRMTPTDLDDVIDAAVASAVLREGVVIDTRGVEPVQMVGDANSLRQLVQNLVENGVRHAGHEVVISVTDEADLAVVVVEDDGPGVPVESRDEIFERFVRLDEARGREAGGSGLGLSIVQEIARAHGGRARVETSSLGGARFVVELPMNLD
ncbi:sensor histidine kinase [Aeromicrobium sp.]